MPDRTVTLVALSDPSETGSCHCKLSEGEVVLKMSAADYACDFWNNAGGHHPYLQQRMNQMQYAVAEGQSQEGHPDFYFNGYNYPGVTDISSSTSTHFRYDQSFNACREQNFSKDSYSATENKSDSPTLRALLTKQKKQQDCSFYKMEETGESSCDYNKLDMVLSPSSERSSEPDRDLETTKPPIDQPQAQFYPWMKSHHGKSPSTRLINSF